MNETQRSDKDEALEYAVPTIADYGDLVELTAAGSTGGHLDAGYAYGDVPGFLSSAP
jgi:hypothetical protein